MIRIDTAEPEIPPFDSTHSSSFLKFGAYITHNPTGPLSDITGVTSSDHMQLPLKG